MTEQEKFEAWAVNQGKYRSMEKYAETGEYIDPFVSILHQGWQAAIASREPLPPVEGDLLPPIGSKVEIHLASIDAWVEHEVVGYYVWPVFEEHLRKSYHRVSVRVVDQAGILNARMLGEIRPVERFHGIGE